MIFCDDEGNRYVEIAYPITFTVQLREDESPEGGRERFYTYLTGNRAFLMDVIEDAGWVLPIVEPDEVTRKNPYEVAYTPDDLKGYGEER